MCSAPKTSGLGKSIWLPRKSFLVDVQSSGLRPTVPVPHDAAAGLSGVEFTRRFALHILPRRFGLLANRSRAATCCRELLNALLPTPPAVPDSPDDESPDNAPRCEQCQVGRLRRRDETPRPRLFDLLINSGYAPRRASAPVATCGPTDGYFTTPRPGPRGLSTAPQRLTLCADPH